ncbi:MAG: HEPN domain-containing protein [Elusimicrobiota bacterium]
MKESQLLLKRAKKYLESSELLINSGDFESATSRSYYSMFYGAQAVLLSKELSFSSHKAVISAFGEHFIKTGVFHKDLGRELNRAFEKRQLSDYEYDFVISEKEARVLLESAHVFFTEVSRYFSS